MHRPGADGREAGGLEQGEQEWQKVETVILGKGANKMLPGEEGEAFETSMY